MSKTKKWIVGILLGLLLGSFIALAICYIAIPERTKCAIDIVIGYLNTPIGLGCGITITGSLVIYIFAKYLVRYALSNSKYGKQELKSLKDTISGYESKAKEYKETAIKSLEEQKVILSDYSCKIDKLTEELIKVCETSPNAKIKAIGEELKGIKEESKVVLTEKLDNLHDSYLEIREQGKDYQAQIDELKELLKGVIENGKEREETLND